MKELTLSLTCHSRMREDEINELDSGKVHGTLRYKRQHSKQARRIWEGMSRIIFGLLAPIQASTNWPSVVIFGPVHAPYPMLKCRAESNPDACYYLVGPWLRTQRHMTGYIPNTKWLPRSDSDGEFGGHWAEEPDGDSNGVIGSWSDGAYDGYSDSDSTYPEYLGSFDDDPESDSDESSESGSDEGSENESNDGF